MQYKVDFHTHSIASNDGGLTLADYTKILQDHILDAIAITDHNNIKFAEMLQKKFGKKIIVGEEIKSKDGEVIGLFLTKEIASGLTTAETIKQIHAQNGLVYIPHPFEKLREGIQKEIFEKYIEEIDICEIFNGRSFERKSENNIFRNKQNKFGKAASSDAHCRLGVGKTFTLLNKIPTRQNILNLLKDAEFSKKYAPFLSYLCPFINRVRKKLNI